MKYEYRYETNESLQHIRYWNELGAAGWRFIFREDDRDGMWGTTYFMREIDG